MVGIKRVAKKYYFRQVVCCWMIFCMAFVLPAKIAMALDTGALPDGFEIVSGSGTLGGGGSTLLIQNISDGSIYRWEEGFNIGSAAMVDFQFTNAGSSVLNRDVTGNMSEIYGKLLANGNVYIVNPAGIVFGSNATIDVTKLVASSLNITNDDFGTGIDRFDINNKDGFAPEYAIISGDGSVTNNTNKFDDDNVNRLYLIGQQVINNGTLLANECVVMAAGDKVIISETDGIVGVEVPVRTSGGALHSVVNAGGIEVDGGAIGFGDPENPAQVVLAAGDIWSSAYITANGAGSASLKMDAAGAVTIDGDPENKVSINASPDYSDPCSTAVASIDIDAGGDIAVTTDVVAHAFGDREVHNAEATVKVNQRRAKDGLAIGDVDVIGDDGSSSIKAVATDGQENTASVFICANNVTLEAPPIWFVYRDWPYAGSASIEAIAEFEDGTNQSNVADVKIGAKGGIEILATGDEPLVDIADSVVASINARAINGYENTASVFLCANDSILVKADISPGAVIPPTATVSEAFIKSEAGTTAETRSPSQASTTVISHNGNVVGDGSLGGEASIKSEVYGGYNSTAATQVFGKDVISTNAAATIEARSDSANLSESDGSLSEDGAVDKSEDGSSLLIDSSDNADLDCPDCGEPEPDPDPDPVAAPIPFRIPRIEGCPELTIAAAMELGINSDTIQVAIGNALALNPNIQPCEACESLVDASNILKDEDGSRMAAVLAAFNAQAPADAPFTPEMGASITMALTDAAQGDQYALSVAEYVDAFVMYVAVLDTELGAPVGDSVAFVMDKYGEGVLANEGIAEFVASRIANMEVFGG